MIPSTCHSIRHLQPILLQHTFLPHHQPNVLYDTLYPSSDTILPSIIFFRPSSYCYLAFIDHYILPYPRHPPHHGFSQTTYSSDGTGLPFDSLSPTPSQPPRPPAALPYSCCPCHQTIATFSSSDRITLLSLPTASTPSQALLPSTAFHLLSATSCTHVCPQ